MKKLLGTTVALAVLAIFISSAPSLVNAQSVINACMNNNSGTLKIVAPATTCHNNETLISWPSTDDDTLGDLACSAGQTVKFNGTAWVCDPPSRFVDNGNRTITDNQTGLVWEKKLAANDVGGNCADINQANRSAHCMNDLYTWSTNNLDPNGTLYTNFLANVNDLVSPNDGTTTTCFAGHCDWRVPTIGELRSILQAPFPLCPASLCIDPIFGPTQPSGYWSSTTFAFGAGDAWFVDFVFGSVLGAGKNFLVHARAVRGGR